MFPQIHPVNTERVTAAQALHIMSNGGVQLIAAKPYVWDEAVLCAIYVHALAALTQMVTNENGQVSKEAANA